MECYVFKMMTCLVTIRATKCGKTQMNYVFRINNTNIFRSITLRKSPNITKIPKCVEKEALWQNGYLGTIAELPIEAPCMDQVILKEVKKKVIKEHIPERKIQCNLQFMAPEDRPFS